MRFLDITRGEGSVILSLPHTGTGLPGGVADALNDRGRALADTDWHIHRLYDGLITGVTYLRTGIHRYAIDVNRGPGGESLYPGRNTTGLCPLTDFDGAPIYRPGREPGPDEIEARREAYHAPYHEALSNEIGRVKALHGFAILYDCHSIRSRIPYLFDGVLPDFNIGTNLGTTCAAEIESAVAEKCAIAEGYTSIRNGHFRGGWTTRSRGRPQEGVHAIQMELSQSTYLKAETPPWIYDPTRASRLRHHLADILETLLRWRPE